MDSLDWLADLIEAFVTGFGPNFDPNIKIALAHLIEASFSELGLVTPLDVAALTETSNVEVIHFPISAPIKQVTILEGV